MLIATFLPSPWQGKVYAQLSRTDGSTAPNHSEILQKRTKNSKHFQLENGTVRSLVTGGVFHYQDDQLQWQDIQTAVLPTGRIKMSPTTFLPTTHPPSPTSRGSTGI